MVCSTITASNLGTARSSDYLEGSNPAQSARAVPRGREDATVVSTTRRHLPFGRDPQAGPWPGSRGSANNLVFNNCEHFRDSGARPATTAAPSGGLAAANAASAPLAIASFVQRPCWWRRLLRARALARITGRDLP